MKKRNKVANVFTNIAPEWNGKGSIIGKCIGQKNPFKTEYRNWIRDGMKILDVGCGAGKNLFRIDSEYENCDLYGVDISEKMIDIAKENNSHNRNFICFIKTDFLDFVPEEKFDVIIFNYVLHHVENPLAVIQKATHYLAPQGILMITVPGIEYLKETFAYCYKVSHDVIGRFSQSKMEDIFTTLDLVQLLYKKSIFLMKFNSYEQYLQYLKSIGTYQKIVNYSTKNWSDEFNQLVLTAYLNADYITGHYDMYIYCKTD